MARKPAPKPAPPKKARKPVQSRRTPYDLVQALKAQRDDLMQKMGDRIGKLDQKIAAMEARYQDRIAIHELTSTRTPKELEQEEAQLKAQLALMRKARKLSIPK